MKQGQTSFTNQVIDNIRKAFSEYGLNQAGLAVASGIPENTLSKLLNKRQALTVDHLVKSARALSLRVIDLITWPEKYQPAGDNDTNPADVLLQMRLTKEKKDQVLKLVFGENDIEVLNK